MIECLELMKEWRKCFNKNILLAFVFTDSENSV